MAIKTQYLIPNSNPLQEDSCEKSYQRRSDRKIFIFIFIPNTACKSFCPLTSFRCIFCNEMADKKEKRIYRIPFYIHLWSRRLNLVKISVVPTYAYCIYR
jgi:hypothetical protein